MWETNKGDIYGVGAYSKPPPNPPNPPTDDDLGTCACGTPLVYGEPCATCAAAEAEELDGVPW